VGRGGHVPHHLTQETTMYIGLGMLLLIIILIIILT
jgi:hypothetical protein